MNNKTAENNTTFLVGGGEMGMMMRSKDWSQTALGDPAGWPHSLRTMVSVMLDNPFGMYIAWGNDYIQLYNDGYRPILGSNKHPHALGISTRETFPEIWHIVGPMFEDVMKGHAFYRPDFMFQLNRNGFVEECYFDFSYSPIRKEDGEVGGVLVTVIETTEKKKAQAELKENKDQLEFAIEAAELGTWDYNPFTDKFTSNNRLKEWFGLPADAEIELHHATDAIAEKDRQRIIEAIRQSLDYATGGTYMEQFSIIHPVTKKETIVQVRGKASFNNEKIAYRLNGTLEDVTKEVLVQRRLEESERKLRLSIMQAPVAIALLRGPSYEVEVANRHSLELWGRKEEQVFNRPILEAMPELVPQGIDKLLNNVYETGAPFAASELPVQIIRNEKPETIYVNFVYEPIYDEDKKINGIMAVGIEMTSHVLARKKIQESEELLRIALEGGELGTFDFYPKTDTLIWSEKTKELFGMPPDADVNIDLYMQALHPDDRNTSQAIAQQKINVQNGGLYDLEYRTIGITDGRLRWVRSKGIAIYDANNNPVRYTGVVQEITKRKEAEQALKESEERFRTIADNISQLAWMANEKGQMIWFNKRWLEYSGTTMEQMLNEGAKNIHHPEHRSRVMDKYLQAVEDGKEWEDTFPLLGADGQYRWFLSRAIAIKNADGKVKQWFGTNTDITQRMEAEQALKESEERFRTMAESSDILIGVNNETVDAVYFNKAWASLTGRPTEDLLKLGWADLLHPEDRKTFLDKFFNAFEKKESYSGEFRMRNKEGNYSWLFAKVQVRLHPDGSYAGHISSCIDITERKKAEDEIKLKEQRIRSLVESAPFPIGVYVGREMRIEMVNDSILRAWDRSNDVIGKLYADVLPELKGQGVYEQLDAVFTTGAPFHAKNQHLNLVVDGKLQSYHYDYSFTPLYDELGEIYGVLNTAANVTELNIANRKIEESDKRFRNTVQQAPIGIAILRGDQFIVEMANEAYQRVVDRTESALVERPLFDSLPEVKETVHPLLNDVLHTGIPFHGIEYPIPVNRYGRNEISYFNFLYHPLKEDDGNISGIIVTVTDVSDAVKAKHTLAESERQFRNLVMQSSIPMAIFRGKDFVIEMANTVMFEKMWRKKETDVIGKKALDVFPELKDQKYPQLLNQVYTTGKPYRENESLGYVQGDDGMKAFYLDYEYAPLFEKDGLVSGIIITVNDVTEKVEARKKSENAEERLRLAIEAAEMGTFDWNLVTQQFFCSDRLKEIFGFAGKEHVTHQDLINRFYTNDKHIRDKALEKSFALGNLEYEARIIWSDKSIHWIKVYGKILHDLKGAMQRMYGTVTDVTEQRSVLENLKENEARFRLLADSMPQHIWTGDIDGNLNYFNKSVFNYSGLTQEQINKDGWIQIVHPDEREQNIRQWMRSITTGEDFIFEHRFRRNDGEYRWQLSRAIPQRDANGNIQMWVGTSTDIQEQKTFANHLEEEVQKRTNELEIKNRELEKMNAELESFAYISSHDLQEPLRKIQTFASLILEKENEKLSDKGKDYFRRMQQAAERMQLLIEDLLAYSRTSTVPGTFVTISLDEIIKEVKSELKETLEEKKAIIESQGMCPINIIPFQVRQLLLNLVGNSIKFARPGIPPFIKLACEMVKGNQTSIHSLSPEKKYCHITVSDNGIGFDPKYTDRIFEVFQRLHGKDQYEGTGIGLAIVKKIVENHYGIITATSEPDKGSRFDIYFPQ